MNVRVRRARLITAALLTALVMTVRVGAAQTTYRADVAPLVSAHCAGCHRPGGSSSVSLLTYSDTRAHARQIVQLTARRQMPPWQPEGEHGTFVGDRRLTDAQIATFRRWLDDGLAEGKGVVPEAPVVSGDWTLGTPDLVLTMPAFSLRADGPDMFRNFVLPVPVTTMKYVRAWEFKPGNARAVHHATMQIDATGASSRYDEDDQSAGYEGLIAPSARAPDGFFLDWAPGHRPNVAVPGTAWPLPASSALVMMLHLRPSGKVEPVQASVALYFADSPPARLPVMLRLTRQDFDIPAESTTVTARDSYVLPVDVEVHTVQPHGHYLAKDMEGTAVTPDGRSLSLVRIRDWDFNWQDVYHYATPLRLPAGTRLSMAITFDNSADNPRNPHRPPQAVGYGQQTDDEMAEMWFQVVPVRADDRRALVESLYRKVLPEEVKGRAAMLRRQPENIALRDDLALLLAEQGDMAGAEREFRTALAKHPASPAARFNVAFAVLAQGRQAEARGLLNDVLAVEPTHALAHFQLGLMAQTDGHLDDAARHVAVAIETRSSDPDVVLFAGVLDALRGDAATALPRLTRALALKPEWPNAQAALASVLSMQPDEESRVAAVALAEAAVRGTVRTNGAFLDILSEALARAGQMARAIVVAREAQQVAAAQGDRQASERIRQRVLQWEAR